MGRVASFWKLVQDNKDGLRKLGISGTQVQPGWIVGWYPSVQHKGIAELVTTHALFVAKCLQYYPWLYPLQRAYRDP